MHACTYVTVLWALLGGGHNKDHFGIYKETIHVSVQRSCGAEDDRWKGVCAGPVKGVSGCVGTTAEISGEEVFVRIEMKRFICWEGEWWRHNRQRNCTFRRTWHVPENRQ